MRENDSGDVVVAAVDAVTLNQDVQWDRCARLATPAERRTLGTLRALARLFTAGDGTGPAPSTPPAAPAAPFTGGTARRAIHLLMALAAVAVAAALLLLPWRWEDYHRANGDVGGGADGGRCAQRAELALQIVRDQAFRDRSCASWAISGWQGLVLERTGGPRCAIRISP